MVLESLFDKIMRKSAVISAYKGKELLIYKGSSLLGKMYAVYEGCLYMLQYVYTLYDKFPQYDEWAATPTIQRSRSPHLSSYTIIQPDEPWNQEKRLADMPLC